MVVLIAGATHTGKTALAQRLLEKYKFPYLSIDHIKMGLIRSGQTNLTAYDDDRLTAYLWPIVREIVKTAVENEQNLIAEGCYIPFDWQKDFSDAYRAQIRYRCLIMSREYIQKHVADIAAYESVIERRQGAADFSAADLIAENEKNTAACKAHGLPYIYIDKEYAVDWDLRP